ncbi:hypothetical protein, partial [Rhodocyclus purpureus]|uniref:hypothetical protein n=1 Tax=Rhodocyclus purpureus TaxID=1067 RepID=UPI001A91A789
WIATPCGLAMTRRHPVIARRVAPWQSSSFFRLLDLAGHPRATRYPPYALDRHALRARDDA